MSAVSMSFPSFWISPHKIAGFQELCQLIWTHSWIPWFSSKVEALYDAEIDSVLTGMLQPQSFERNSENPRNCTCFQCFLLFSFILDALNCFVPAKLWNSYFRRSAWRVPFVLFRWSGNLWVARAERRASTFCIFLFLASRKGGGQRLQPQMFSASAASGWHAVILCNDLPLNHNFVLEDLRNSAG